jgi:hypothetical protein
VKRVTTAGLFLVLVCTLAGPAAGSASAVTYECLPARFLGEYDEYGAIGAQCNKFLVIPWAFNLTLSNTATVKSIGPGGELCGLVEPGELSLFNGPNCGHSEEHKGESEYEIVYELKTGGWMVNGTSVVGGAELASTAAVDKKSVLNGGGLNIECSGSAVNSVWPEALAATNRLRMAKLGLTGCATTNANCTVPAEIGTVPVEAATTLEGVLGAKAVFKPQSGTTFATIKFSGEACAVAGVKAVTGDANTSLPTARDERTAQLLEVSVSSAQNLLFFASGAASLTGSELLQQIHGSTWSFL